MEKTYDHQSCEKQARTLWEKEKPYTFNEKTSKKVFSIDTPPPTVSGSLHIGHIFSYTHTDIIARYKRLVGHNVFYPMGFDDNGLPTERFVEKKNKTKAHLHKRSDFIKLCLVESIEVEKEFEQLWKDMGLSIDWNKTYSTISDKSRKISQYSFIDLYKKGFIDRKEEPALYCTTCRTSVAQAELDSTNVKTTFNDIEFMTEDGKKVTIATTRPELLPACVAVFFHPDDKRYKDLENTQIITPVFNKKVPVLADEKVDPEKGSGLVMCCTFGDSTDIEWYKKHKLPFIHIVGFDGKWSQAAGALEGLRAHEARKKVLELLKENGSLLEQKSITHAVNVHERCKQEIEYLILKQWFVKILEHKQKFLDAAEKINWVPTFMKSRYIDWVENLAWDWCISRQRFYGIPFPVWHCNDCNHVILADEKKLPIDPQEQNYDGPCPQCKKSNIVPDTDVMDTWATSSLTPQINVDWPEKSHLQLPMSMRPQAHDIIRTWAFYTIVKAHYHNQTIPWDDIVISGHVLAGREKISKSKGGIDLTPEGLLSRYPADTLRYWTAKGRIGTDTAFSENQLKVGNKLLTKLWNAFRFCKDHIENYEKPKKTPQLNELNQWLLHRLTNTITSYKKFFDKYDYSHALDEVETFFWNDFCDNYLELIKDQIFNPDNYDSTIIEGTRFTLHEVGFALLQLFGPVVPHITETLYQQFYKKQENDSCLHSITLDTQRFSFDFKESVKVIENLLSVVGQVRTLKSNNSLSLKTELASLTIHGNKKLEAQLKEQLPIIAGITHAHKIEFSTTYLDKPQFCKEKDVWHAKVQL